MKIKPHTITGREQQLILKSLTFSAEHHQHIYPNLSKDLSELKEKIRNSDMVLFEYSK